MRIGHYGDINHDVWSEVKLANAEANFSELFTLIIIVANCTYGPFDSRGGGGGVRSKTIDAADGYRRKATINCPLFKHFMRAISQELKTCVRGSFGATFSRLRLRNPPWVDLIRVFTLSLPPPSPMANSQERGEYHRLHEPGCGEWLFEQLGDRQILKGPCWRCAASGASAWPSTTC